MQEEAADVDDLPAPAAVARVIDDWMSDRREMDADLVRAARVERAPDESRRGRIRVLLEDLVRRARFASARRHGHAGGRARRSTDRRVDQARAASRWPHTSAR